LILALHRLYMWVNKSTQGAAWTDSWCGQEHQTALRQRRRGEAAWWSHKTA